MTNKDRILAVVRGEPVDRVPFVMYEGILPVTDVIEHLGPGTIGIMKWSNIHRVDYPHCRTEIDEYESDGRRQQKKTIHTPAGTMFEERAFEPAYGSSSIIKHFVEEEKDYEVFWSYLQDGVISPDYERFHADQSALGENGVPLVAVERTPYQQLWVQWTGLDNLGYHFADFPDKVEHTVSILTDRAHRIFEIVRDSPAPFIDFPDNITAPTIGPERFEKYCVPFYRKLANMLEESGRPVFVHMDGDLKALWKSISTSGVKGLDSFSPAPDNDTTVADAVRLWPEMRLFMNFPSSVHLKSRTEIMATTREILETAAGTGRLQIQLSENVPYGVWRNSLPAIADALNDYYS